MDKPSETSYPPQNGYDAEVKKLGAKGKEVTHPNHTAEQGQSPTCQVPKKIKN